MSDTNPEIENPSSTTNDIVSRSIQSPSEPKLKRETIVMVNDRGRLGLLVALCSLAGVAVGFGLSSMASGLYAHHCSASAAHHHVQSVQHVETPPWLGVRITTSRDGGAHVEWVEPSSPAQYAGIQRGDVIVGFARSRCPKRVQSVGTSSELVRRVRSADVGERVWVKIRRDGRTMSVATELQHMPLGLFQRETRRWR